MSIISNNLQQAVALLQANELVAIPTETVYGLAGNAFSDVAINKIFAMKNRPHFNPLIVHIHSVQELSKIVKSVPNKAQLLADAFWPGPLTLVLPKKDTISSLVTAGKDTVAVRIPNHPVALALLKMLPFPLAAPSANPFGSISPTTAGHVERYFKDKLQMVLQGGDCMNGIESTIIGFTDGEPVLYRHGSISLEDIQAVVGNVIVQTKENHAPQAPGMLDRHYAPNTKTVLTDKIENYLNPSSDLKIGIITFSKTNKPNHVAYLEVLSPKGDLKEATANLYSALHRLDSLGLDLIIAERFPNYGLGKSINDRLERATKSK